MLETLTKLFKPRPPTADELANEPSAADRAAAIAALSDEERPAALEDEGRTAKRLHDGIVARWHEAMRPAAEAWAAGHYLPAIAILRMAWASLVTQLARLVGRAPSLDSMITARFAVLPLLEHQLRGGSGGAWFFVTPLGGVFGPSVDEQVSFVLRRALAEGATIDDREIVCRILELELAVSRACMSNERDRAIADAKLAALRLEPLNYAQAARAIDERFEREERERRAEEARRNPPVQAQRPPKLSLGVRF